AHLARHGVADVERTAVCRDVDRTGARDVEAQALDVASLLYVLELLRIVERAEQRVLRSDRGDIEGRRHQRAIDHDRRADAVHAGRAHDPFVVHGDGRGPAFPRGVNDVGEIGGVTDRLVDVAGGDAHVARVVQLDQHTVAGERRKAGAGLEL